MPPEINTIFIGGIRIDEPIVSLTDLFISVLSFYYFYKLNSKVDQSLTIKYFKYYFLLMGIATTFGGIVGHAFLYALPFAWKLPGWVISMVAIMMLERAAIEHTKVIFNAKIIKSLRIINIIEFLIFLTLTFYYLDFKFVELHTAYGLLVVLFSLELYIFIKTRSRGSRTLLMAVLMAGLAAFAFIYPIVIHQWFNHLCLSHVFMCIATVLIYRGAIKIGKQEVITENSISITEPA